MLRKGCTRRIGVQHRRRFDAHPTGLIGYVKLFFRLDRVKKSVICLFVHLITGWTKTNEL
jgi:hypothetical protein